MDAPMAVNLKTIPSENVTISYAYSLNTPLESEPTTLTTNTKFECQVLPTKGDKIYVYVVISPQDNFSSVEFTQEVVFYIGMAGQINIVNGSEIITQTIVKRQELTENILNTPTIEEGYAIGGWYYDKECTKQVTFPFRTQGISLYPKVINLIEIRNNVVYSRNGVIDSEGFTLYGAYPQDYVGDTLNTTLKNALSAGTLQATSWKYTTDIDGKTTTLTEYEYNGSYYAYLPSAMIYDSYNIFDNGQAVVNGNAYFFTVEPLQWTNHNGTYLCEKAIGSKIWNGSTIWKDSEMRTYLNEVFYIESGISLVKKNTTTIPNNTTSGETDAYNGTPTADYIWLPSYQEVSVWYSSDSDRIKYNTDFNDASYGRSWESGTTNYWTRSADSTVSLNGIRYNGARIALGVGLAYRAICPCFSLD